MLFCIIIKIEVLKNHSKLAQKDGKGGIEINIWIFNYSSEIF